MEDMVDTDSAATEPTNMAMAVSATARGLLTPRLMPTMAMEDMVLAFMARGQLIPMPTTVTVELTPDSVMADTAMVVLATAMASKCQWYDCYSDVYPWICTKAAAGNCNI